MEGAYDVRQVRAAVGDKRIPYTVQRWEPEDMVITEHATAFMVDRTMNLYHVACILCDTALSGIPFVLITIASHMACCTGYPHLTAITVARHVSCEMPDIGQFTDMMLAKNNLPARD